MKGKRIFAALLALALVPAAALGVEGGPLLGVDDLLSLEESYGAFLDELEALIVERGLLSEEDRAAWRAAQMGDFFQNGGYGSILASYMPGALGLTREEDTLLTLSVPLDGNLTLEIGTMRRYTPQDSSLPGLMLTLSLDALSGAPRDAAFTLVATSGIFLKWDALAGAYKDVGVSALSEGETVVWSDQTPAENARAPRIEIAVADAITGEPLGDAVLTLAVEGESYCVADGALARE